MYYIPHKHCCCYGSAFTDDDNERSQLDNLATINIDWQRDCRVAIFEGNMKLLSTSTATDANFVNGATGTVLANGDGGGSVAVLLFAAGLDIDDADTGTPKWQATSDTDAQLRFDVSDTGLDGEFTISGCATLYLDDGVDIYTTGDLVATANDYNIRTDSSATYCFKYLFGGGDQVDVCGNISCP